MGSGSAEWARPAMREVLSPPRPCVRTQRGDIACSANLRRPGWLVTIATYACCRVDAVPRLLTPKSLQQRSTALVLLVLAALLAPDHAPAQNAANTERRLQQAREQLRQTAAQRRQTEQSMQAANAQLRQADARVARASRSLADVEHALAVQNAQLTSAQKRRTQLQADIANQRSKLASLLRDSQREGNHSALKLLLSQDQLSDSQRVLAYHRYLQQQRLDTLERINTDLAQVQALEQESAQLRQGLLEKREQQKLLATQLSQERNTHRQAVAAINAEHAQKQSREAALSRDVRSLETVLANLRAQAARAAAAQRAARNANASAGTNSRPRTGQPARGQQAPAAQPGVRVGGGAWPLSGTMVRRFGARQADGRTSTGILIEAAAGAPVTAVADGKVVYSDWMTGYGMILIIDHGNGYMSLYAHNESLLRDNGSQVKRGESVARVGNSGGQGRNALYFELRRNGQPVDPASWLRR